MSINKCKIISHCGNNNKPNDLINTIHILNKYNNIDMVEIDVIYENNTFLVSHDYNSSNCDTLETFINTLIMKKNDLCIWLDIKDKHINILPIEPSFNYKKFDTFLYQLNNKIKITDKIFISCQYTELYNKLKNCPFINKNITIIYDAISSKYYITSYLFNFKTINNIYDNFIIDSIYNDICNDDNSTNIIAIDVNFFSSKQNLLNFIDKIIKLDKYKFIILYCYNFNKLDNYIIHYKNIKFIYMYNLT
jgi:hypothetical protein